MTAHARPVPQTAGGKGPRRRRFDRQADDAVDRPAGRSPEEEGFRHGRPDSQHARRDRRRVGRSARRDGVEPEVEAEGGRRKGEGGGGQEHPARSSPRSAWELQLGHSASRAQLHARNPLRPRFDAERRSRCVPTQSVGTRNLAFPLPSPPSPLLPLIPAFRSWPDRRNLLQGRAIPTEPLQGIAHHELRPSRADGDPLQIHLRGRRSSRP